MAGRTQTFLGERYRRIAKQQRKKHAMVAVPLHPRHRLASTRQRGARFTDLGPNHFTRLLNPDRQKRNHIRHPEVLGYTVTLTPAA
ncbi:MAG: hypothetical protein ACRDTK_00160 [Mycobacterium sp.]